MSLKGYLLATLFALTACTAGTHIMTLESFYDIPVGSSQEQVVALSGKPYSTKKRADGTVEYEYIERIKAGGRDIQERHYIITFKEGKVVAKRVEMSSPPPYGFDSYDMQTTQNNRDSK